MSADDNDDEDSLEAAEKSASRTGRLLMFLFINGPTTLLTLAIWIRVGTRSGSHASDSWLKMAFAVWIIGLVMSTIALFKK